MRILREGENTAMCCRDLRFGCVSCTNSRGGKGYLEIAYRTR